MKNDNDKTDAKILIGLPAFNEGKVIGDFLDELLIEREKIDFDILVVDDGSVDDTYQICQSKKIKIIKHKKNIGTGGAVKTILKYTKNNHYDFLVFMDCDGQHRIVDLEKMLKVKYEADFILGVRGIFHTKMPIQRKIANIVGNFMTWFFFGKLVNDSQSGFKILNKKSINCMQLSFDKYEFCSEMFYFVSQNKLQVKEIPIEVHYDKHSLKKKHGQSISNGFKMIYQFTKWKKNKIFRN